MRKILLFSILLLLPWMAKAKNVSVNNGVIYLLVDTDTKKASLTSHPQKYSGDVVIPEAITYNGDVYSVVQIGSGAFKNCTGLTSVSIPKSIVIIGNEAFVNCSGLTSIEIPNSVTKIGDSSFSGCTGLTSIIIPESVTTIGSNAFANCLGLTSISIPNTVTSVGNYVFQDCTGLTSATILCSAAPGYDVFRRCSNLKEVVFNCEKVYGFFSENNIIENVTFGEDVKSIEEKAFYYCKKLQSVNLSSSITSIGPSAFVYCEGLTSITIPNEINNIGKDAFGYCKNLMEVCISDLKAWCNIVFENEYASPIVYGKKLVLNGNEITNLVIPDGVTAINIAAFANGVNFQSITIPGSVTTIADYAFDGCSAVKKIVIPEGVTSIGVSAFANCDALEEISLPSSLTSIGARAFRECKALKLASISDIAAWCQTQFGDEEASPFYFTNSLYVKEKSVSNLVIPDGVTVINAYAFGRCVNIETLRLPNSLTEIGNHAFCYCDNLTEIYSFADKAPSLKDNAFYGSSNYSMNLYVQESSKENYQNAYWWKYLKIHTVPDGTPQKCAKPTVSFEDGKIVFKCETKGVEFVSQVLDNSVTAHSTSNIPVKPKYIVRVIARIKGSEDSDVTTAEFEWDNDNPQITYIR